MPVLVIEGVNCTGKSTLAKLFSDRTGLEIVKFGVAPKQNPFRYFAANILQAAQRNENFIIDRCHLSNYAYQEMQDSGVMAIPYWQMIDKELARLHAWLFLLTDDVFQIEQRMQERRKGDGADGWDRPRIALVQRRFEEAFEMSRLEPRGQFSLPLFISADGQPTPQFEDVLTRFQQACR